MYNIPLNRIPFKIIIEEYYNPIFESNYNDESIVPDEPNSYKITVSTIIGDTVYSEYFNVNENIKSQNVSNDSVIKILKKTIIHRIKENSIIGFDNGTNKQIYIHRMGNIMLI